ncbi:MAG TPA: magnesium-translocating P-type ATPase [Bacteroidales bacterium]|nr:magnesium-translocating P-type ATPase [Bacteroidales bacterium]
MERNIHQFWSISQTDLFNMLNTGVEGLASAEAHNRLSSYGANRLKPPKRSGSLTLLAGQFKSPIILILLFATGLSFFLHDPADAAIILAIVLISGLLGFWQEHSANDAVKKLLAVVRINTTVIRDGERQKISNEETVPGDIVILGAGDIVPCDCRILESKDVFADESMLTGENYPVEKSASVLSGETALAQRTNCLWMGTHIVSGTAMAMAVHTGTGTEFGKVAERLRLKPQETEFEHGIRKFGYFLAEVTMILVMIIFAINVYLHRPVMDSFLFSLALAVGLTPQLLPAIISINLSHGAKKMAEKKVIVKRLASIENFGSMDILCSDKTGTLTEGTVKLHSTVDINGSSSERVFFLAYINAFYETGFSNPIDEAIRSHGKPDLAGCEKHDEIPYDFIRKRLSIVVTHGGNCLMITKGALANILEVCTSVETGEGRIADISMATDQIRNLYSQYSTQGYRTLGVAYRQLPGNSCHGGSKGPSIGKESESGMTFAGFLVLEDPPKPGIIETIEKLKGLGVSLKIITGDNRLVALSLSRRIGLPESAILTGREIHETGDNALLKSVTEADIFAEIEPNQKERIITALRKAGKVVGYMGDGINDASALHSADVGISVDSGADVAKDASDIVLLEKDLSVLVEGVTEGRRTFANTLKYVFMATSANFGNMFSMAGVSLILPFLPLLPKQILLTNLMTDFPEMTIATDNVDNEMVDSPKKWNITAIRKFMVTFGLISSIFDYITFGLLLLVLHAGESQFRTGWFIESVVSASLIVLVIRSRKSFYRSRPGKYLLAATLSVVAFILIVPMTPVGKIFDFVALPFKTCLLLMIIVALYVITAEIAKKIFYRNVRI